MTARLLVAGIVCAGLFVALGLWVTHHPLSRLDVLGSGLRGAGLPAAVVLTTSGYGAVLTLLAVATVGGALVLRLPVTLPLAIIVSQLASQAVVNLVKSWFDRSRPGEWLYRHEAGLSYPSGHATTAVVFYGAWLLVLWNSSLPLPVRLGGGAGLALWALGIGWSRIALGAHYPTDVAGGFLFGAAWLCIVVALVTSRSAGFVARHG